MYGKISAHCKTVEYTVLDAYNNNNNNKNNNDHREKSATTIKQQHFNVTVIKANAMKVL